MALTVLFSIQLIWREEGILILLHGQSSSLFSVSKHLSTCTFLKTSISLLTGRSYQYNKCSFFCDVLYWQRVESSCNKECCYVRIVSWLFHNFWRVIPEIILSEMLKNVMSTRYDSQGYRAMGRRKWYVSWNVLMSLCKHMLECRSYYSSTAGSRLHGTFVLCSIDTVVHNLVMNMQAFTLYVS